MKRKLTVIETLAFLGGVMLVMFTLMFWIDAGLKVFEAHLGICK